MKEVAAGDFVRGKLLYAPQLGQDFFVLRGIGVAGLIGEQTSSIATYRTETYGVVFDPRFSSDGSRILFKVGWPFDSTGSYQLYLWEALLHE